MILMVVLVYMVMASQFESYMGPLVIMLSIPFALIGVFFGLRVTGTALGLMALIGVIILLGIVVKKRHCSHMFSHSLYRALAVR